MFISILEIRKTQLYVFFWKILFCPFYLKTIQNLPFWLKIPKHGGFWSLDEVVSDLWNHVCPFVDSSVRLSRSFSKTVHYFSETLQLVTAFKPDKNASSTFLKNSHFSHFGQKLQNLLFYPKIPKNEIFAFFVIKFKNGLFWPNLGHFLPKSEIFPLILL